MKRALFLASCLLALASSSTNVRAQAAGERPAKVIAVVNRANWCTVCKANGQRFGALLMPYSAKGIAVMVNDLTDSTTAATSATTLREAGVYDAVNAVPRKGMGKMMQSCNLLKAKQGANTATGIVTFIDPATHKRLRQLSIATPDMEMRQAIDQLLADAR